MSNLVVPEIGENFNGYIPAKVEMAHITVAGVDGSTATADLVLTSAATALFTLLDVNVPILVTGMWTFVTTAFTASVDLEIGDTASVETFFDEATIGATTADTALTASTGLGVPLKKLAGEDITLDMSGAVAETGVLEVYIQYVVLAD